MAITDASGLPIAACIASASPHEVKLVEKAIKSLFIAEKPKKLIGDKAYDSDKLDAELLKKHRIEMMRPASPQQDSAKNSGRTKVEAVQTSLEN